MQFANPHTLEAFKKDGTVYFDRAKAKVKVIANITCKLRMISNLSKPKNALIFVFCLNCVAVNDSMTESFLGSAQDKNALSSTSESCDGQPGRKGM